MERNVSDPLGLKKVPVTGKFCHVSSLLDIDVGQLQNAGGRMELSENCGQVLSCWKLALGLSLMFSFPHSQAATASVQLVNLTLYWGKWAMSEVYHVALSEEKLPPDKLVGVLVVPEGDTQDACNPETSFNVPPNTESWIAFIARGGCTFKDKIRVAAAKGASGVIIYDHLCSGSRMILISTRQEPGDIVALMITSVKGKQIVRMIRGSIRVNAVIEMRTIQCLWKIYLCAFSLILTFVAYVVLGCTPGQIMARCEERRIQTTKSELRRAVSSLAVRKLRRGEVDLAGETCVVCMDTYKPQQVLRILTCRHIFHKKCVDRWLLKRGVCPICNYDILRRS